MKKILLILVAFLALNANSQTATSALQTAGNNTLVAINNKLAGTLTVTSTGTTTTAGTVTVAALPSSTVNLASATQQVTQSNYLNAIDNNTGDINNSINGLLTLTSTSATATGTLSAGFKTASFSTSSNFVGTINTQTINPSTNLSIPAILNYSYSAVPYTISSGTLIIHIAQ